MNPDRLLQHFDQIAEAPDAVPRLRRFVLDLAVRGKLVEQGPGDEPAADLLKRIKEEKIRLAKNGEARAEKSLPAIADNETPFTLPRGWTWARLRDVTSYIQRGKSPKYAAGDGPLVVSQKCVQWDGLHLEWAKAITPESLVAYEPFRFLRDGDLLWNSTGTGTIGRVIRVAGSDGGLVCDSHVTVVRCLGVDERFVRTWLRSDHVYGNIEARAAGSTNQVELTSAMANTQPTPLPPLAEQHRIVAKVDELMVLCDELEAAQAKREARRDRLVAATLHDLGVGGYAVGRDAVGRDGSPSRPPFPHSEDDRGALGESALPKAGGFGETALPIFLGNLPRLTTRLEHIQELRQTILNLAVRGKLVEQDPGDEPVPVLLARIDREKDAAGQRRQFSCSEVMSPMPAGECPFEIPASWRWVNVAEVGSGRLGKMLDKAKNRGEPRPYLRNVNVRWFNFDLSDLLEMRFEEDELDEFSLKRGDVLICEGGEPGRAAVWDERETGIYFQKAIHRVRLFGTIHPLYFARCIRHDATSGRLAEYFTGVGIKHLTGKGLAQYTFPLPPLAEQHRIVAKVDELMALCDELEGQLAAGATTRAQLLEATLAEALGRDAVGRDGSPSRPHSDDRGAFGEHALPNRGALGESALPKNIPQAILAHIQPGVLYSRADITEALGISNVDWTWAIRQLKESGKVLQTGDRRGARYSTISNP